MRVPQVFTASEIANWHIAEEYQPRKWRPARPLYFTGFRYFTMRLRISWRVFTGKYDALNWQDTGEKSNQETNYIDCLNPDFKKKIYS